MRFYKFTPPKMRPNQMRRRDFIVKSTKIGIGMTALNLLNSCVRTQEKVKEPKLIDSSGLFFKISLAQWSLHKSIQAGEISTFDFAQKSRQFGCEGLEYVTAFFKNEANNTNFLNQLNNISKNEGQENLLLMVDGEGDLAISDTRKRFQSIENHFKWVDAAHKLNCHSIRVNLGGGKDLKEAGKNSIDSLNQLSNYAKGSNVNILVENHNGMSSNGKWMESIFKQVSNKNVGTLPDFGNFCLEKNLLGQCQSTYDNYQGIGELMPFAKAVSAKSYDFDTSGYETTLDYKKLLQIVKDNNYSGYIGIEYEGTRLPEAQGIQLTRDLLISVGKQLQS